MKQARHYTITFAAGAIALSLSSCNALKSVGGASKKAVAPIGAVGEKTVDGLKAINPMRLMGKKKGPQDPTEVAAQPSGGEPAGGQLKPVPAIDTRTTLTPGAQPDPTRRNADGREILTLPAHSQPFTQPQPAEVPLSIPPPESTPGVTARDPELEPLLPPSISAPKETTPLETPSILPPESPKLEDDGFLKLSPKLPEEESILPPN